jgi:hypothetical protein
MFPIAQPGVVDPGIARRPDAIGVAPLSGVQPVELDPHAPRAAAPQVDAAQAQSTTVRQEPAPLPDATPAQRRPVGPGAPLPGALPGALAGAAPGNRAAQLSPDLQWLLQCLQALGQQGADGEAGLPMVRWPAPTLPLANTPAEALHLLRDSLGRSPLFAANPRTSAALAAGAARVAAGQGGAAGGQGPMATAAPAELLDALTDALAPPAGDSPARAAPGSDADAARQALQLLLHGRLQWSGELTPGVPARLSREDAWEEDAGQPGRLLAGSALRLDIDLPSCGPLVVLARQVGGQLSLRLLPGDARQAPRFQSALADLRAALAQLSEQPIDLQLQAPAA